MDTEVTYVKFIDHNIFGRGKCRLFKRIPAFRFEFDIIQVNDLAESAVQRKTQRIGVGHQIRFDIPRGWHVDFHLVEIVLTLPIFFSCNAPDTRRGIKVHGQFGKIIRVGTLPDEQADVLLDEFQDFLKGRGVAREDRVNYDEILQVFVDDYLAAYEVGKLTDMNRDEIDTYLREFLLERERVSKRKLGETKQALGHFYTFLAERGHMPQSNAEPIIQYCQR